INNALADGRRHFELENKDRSNITKRRECHRMLRLEHAGGNHRGNGVGGIVKAVHKVEHQCQKHQQNHDPEAETDSFQFSRSAQEFSRTMPSMRLPTSSQRSVTSSSSSYSSFNFKT